MTDAASSKTDPFAADDPRTQSVAQVRFIDEARSRESLRTKAAKETEAMAVERAEIERSVAAETAARIKADSDAIEEAKVRIAVEVKARTAALERAKAEHDATTAMLARLSSDAMASVAARSRIKAEEEAKVLAEARAQADAVARRVAEERIQAETQAMEAARARAALEIAARDAAARRAKIQQTAIHAARAMAEAERLALERVEAKSCVAESAHASPALAEKQSAATSSDRVGSNETVARSQEDSAPSADAEDVTSASVVESPKTTDRDAIHGKPRRRGGFLIILAVWIILVAGLGASAVYLWFHPKALPGFSSSTERGERLLVVDFRDRGANVLRPPSNAGVDRNQESPEIAWNGWRLSSEITSPQSMHDRPPTVLPNN